MIRIVKAVQIVCLLLPAVSSFAQDRNTVSQQNAWAVTTASVRLTKKCGLYSEGQYRSAGPFSEIQQILLRGGIEYFINSDAAFTAGYGYVMTYPYGAQPVQREFKEHRAWQQVSLGSKSGRVAFNHRYRLEQRWLQKQQNEARDEFTYVNRLRYRALMNVPVNMQSIEAGALFLSVADEVFLNFGKNVRYNIFDQNRLFAGIGYQLTPSWQVQAGYLNQLIHKANGIDQENNHTWQISLGWKFDLRNEEK